MKYFFALSLIFVLIACNGTTENDSPDIIFGPEEGTYDYYIGLSYSGDQSQYVDENYFYVIIANETDNQIQSIELEIEDTAIDLEYAKYDGVVFYIAYFYLATDESFNFKLTINDVFNEINLPTISLLDCELPQTINTDEDVPLNWYIAEDPQVIYVEGFQHDTDFNILVQEGDNFPVDDREFIMPANWLWSEENTEIRAIQVGITNFVVENRIAITMSDGAYREYN